MVPEHSQTQKEKEEKKLQLDKKGIYEKETTPKKDRALDVYIARIDKLSGKKGIAMRIRKLEQRLPTRIVLGMARDTTNTSMLINSLKYFKLGGIAEDVGLELDKYDAAKFQLKNALESLYNFTRRTRPGRTLYPTNDERLRGIMRLQGVFRIRRVTCEFTTGVDGMYRIWYIANDPDEN